MAGCSFPFCFKRISTLPSASSNSLLQEVESCTPSSKSFNAFSSGTLPFSSSSTICSRRCKQSSNLGTGPGLHGHFTPKSIQQSAVIVQRAGKLIATIQGALLPTVCRLARRSALPIQHVDCRRIPSQWCGHLRALDQTADLLQHLAGNENAFRTGCVCIGRTTHAVDDGIRH